MALYALLVACTAASDEEIELRAGRVPGEQGALSARHSFIRAEQAKADGRYLLESDGVSGSVRAPHTALGVEAVFDTDGMSLLWGESRSVTLRFGVIGRHGAMRPVGSSGALATASNRVTLEHGEGLREWWLNGPLGIEHGAVIAERPSGPGLEDGQGALVLTVEVKGATAALDGEGGARLLLPNGTMALRYTDLFVEDAAGAPLPAEMQVVEGNIELRIDDGGALYPLYVDPLIWAEQKKLLASDGLAGDDFGSSASISGDTAIVGAPDDKGKAVWSGSVYVFVRNNAVWTEQQRLIASDGGVFDEFGCSVTIAGDTAIVGAYGDDDNGIDSGAAYVFTRSGGIWTQKQKLLASDGLAGDYFGVSVTINGDTTIVGASRDDDNGSGSGSAYVFTRSGGVWTPQQKLLS